jgi:hypothetical protein
MANRGRDVKVSILSDVDQFDLDKPAKDLSRLGQEALDAERDLDKLNDAARANDLKELGTDEKSAAEKVDSAFDKIAKSSRSNLRRMDDDTDRAKRGLDDLKDEAGESGREAAASFSGGFDDVADFMQETIANGLAGLGKVGAAAGIAAAVGLGILVNQMNEVKERIKETKDALYQLGRDGADAFDRQKDALDRLQSQGNLANYRDAVKNVGASWEDFVKGMGGDTDALDRVWQKADEAANSYGGLATAWDDAAKGGQVLTGFIGEQREALVQAKGDLDAYTEGIEGNAEAVLAMSESLAAVTDGSGTMAAAIEDAAQRQADATKDAGDSAETYRDTVLASIDDVIAKQLEQLTAAQDYEANAKKVYDRLGQDAVDWALSQGENADKAMQLLANAPLKKGKQVVDNYRRLGEKSDSEHAKGLLAGKAPSAASEVHEEMRRRLSGKIDVPVGVQSPSSASLARAREQIRQGIGGIYVDAIVRTPKGRMII